MNECVERERVWLINELVYVGLNTDGYQIWVGGARIVTVVVVTTVIIYFELNVYM